MKLSCNVVKDLLPSYIDELCSEESRELVKAHLCECSECREYCNNMRSELAGEKKTVKKVNPVNEKELIQKVNRKYRNQSIRNFFVGVIACILIVCLVLALFTPSRRLKASEYEITYSVYDMNLYIDAGAVPHDIIATRSDYIFLSDEYDIDKLDDAKCICLGGQYIICNRITYGNQW